MGQRILWILAAWVGMAPAPALAIVDIEAVHIGQPPEGLSGRFNASLGGASGNTDTLAGQLDGTLAYRRGRSTSFLAGQYRYGRSHGRSDRDQGYVHLRHRRRFLRRLAWEAFLQFERNRFARLKRRDLYGGGLRRALIEEPDVRALYVGIGPMYERERLQAGPSTWEALRPHRWRINAYASLTFRPRKGMTVRATSYYQPAASHPGDFHLLAKGAIEIELWGGAALATSLELAHDHAPPLGVKRTDLSYLTGLEWRR